MTSTDKNLAFLIDTSTSQHNLLDRVGYQYGYIFIPEKLQNVLNQQEEFSHYACAQEEEQMGLQQSESPYWLKRCLSQLLLQPL